MSALHISTGRRRLAAACAAALTCAAALGAPTAHAATSCGAAADQVPMATTIAQANAATICLINNERQVRGLVNLTSNQALFDGANRHTRDMVARHFLSHTGSDGSTPLSRLKPYYTGFSSWSVGEIIYSGIGSSGTPRKAVNWWMTSPNHKAQILTAGYRNIGAAVSPLYYKGGAGGTYTVTFGRRS
jgi:uncharacterized protein YkwD